MLNFTSGLLSTEDDLKKNEHSGTLRLHPTDLHSRNAALCFPLGCYVKTNCSTNPSVFKS